MKTSFLLSLTTLGILFLVVAVNAQTGSGSHGGVWHTKIGDVDFYTILDDVGEMDNGVLLADDKAALERLCPTGATESAYAVFVVKKGDDIVLIDTGMGRKMLPRLQTIGIAPKDVKHILLTHSHGDHVGGLVKDDQRVFPEATLWIDADELSFWKSARGKALCEQCEKLYGEMKILTPDEKTATIIPELVSVPLHGHTPGQTGFLLDSDGRKLLVLGDLLHHGAVQFARPDISVRFDDDPKHAAQTRRETLQRAADEQLLVAVSHLPYPSVGTVKVDGDGFRYTPIVEEPEPGKQVAQTIDLPAVPKSSRQPRRTQAERDAEKARRDALTQEQRDSEDKERRLKSFEEMRNPKPLSETETQTVSYLLYLPKDYETKTGKQWPLMLFLHGSGERGSDVEKVKVHGPPKLLSDPEKAKDWPFITVSPQCPDDYSWTPLQLGKLLDELESRYAIDKSRVDVTGLSMGGFGTWGLLYTFPDRFAAGVPICGGFNPDGAEAFVDIPMRVFHGAKDQAVKVEMSVNMVDAIKEKGGKRIELTVYPDLEHDSWTVTYDNPELYRWLLEQRKAK